MRIAFLLPAALTAACAIAAPITPNPGSASAASTKAVTTPLVRTGRTISNQQLRLPQGDAEVVAAAIDIPAGGATPVHQHPWSRFVYVERGPVRIINHDTGESRDFATGTLLPEVIAQWHEAQALTSPVHLVVIDLVPPGVSNMAMKPAH